MIVKNVVKKNTYFDSVTLMSASSKLCAYDGIENAAIMMGTEHNEALMRNSGLIGNDIEAFTPNDTVIGILCEDEKIYSGALVYIDELLTKKNKQASQAANRARTIQMGSKLLPDSNFSVVSIPGKYARKEVGELLELEKHVLLFSDNVSLADEIALKEKAMEKGLLMMGPDCGTAIINGVALGFANVVKRGNIGLAAASGTGLQEVTCLISELGGGISQALGTGGRDLKEAVGGMMMAMCINALKEDPDTEVITLISKPPDKLVRDKIMALLTDTQKPVVICFLGGDPAEQSYNQANIYFAKNLEDAAYLSVKLGKAHCKDIRSEIDSDIEKLAESEVQKFMPCQKYIRGLYAGGTLCFESMLDMSRDGIEIYSNIAVQKELLLADPEVSKGNTLLDMGEDYFTNGMPHPMIEPRLRQKRILKEGMDPAMAIMLLDCVIGYGSHENPAGMIAEAVTQIKSKARQEGRYICVIASVCGTEGDPQKRSSQEAILRSAGILVMPSNYKAARLTAEIYKRL